MSASLPGFSVVRGMLRRTFTQRRVKRPSDFAAMSMKRLLVSSQLDVVPPCYNAEIPGVLSVQSDESFRSDNKDYAGDTLNGSDASLGLATEAEAPIRTRKLFVTGLSFYTSEKTLQAAFEGYSELVEVKVILDKISKRSKGYAFVEYTTEEATSAVLKEMNSKIINGWMIVVDVARSNPPRNSGSRSPT